MSGTRKVRLTPREDELFAIAWYLIQAQNGSEKDRHIQWARYHLWRVTQGLFVHQDLVGNIHHVFCEAFGEGCDD
jgi:hypothetical protein